MSRLKKSALAAALCATTLTGFEGARQNAYPDPATRGKPWTICMGHTEGVRPGDTLTLAECKALLLVDLESYASGVERCIRVPMADQTYVAFISLAYNIGIGAFCKSSVANLYNNGQARNACDAMLHYNRAAGVVFPGLTHRREKERALCLQGAAT